MHIMYLKNTSVAVKVALLSSYVAIPAARQRAHY